MKLLFENWRKLLEGEVIDFPTQPRLSQKSLNLVINIEDQVGQRLAELYGNMSEIPVDKIIELEDAMNSLEELLKK